MTLQLPEVIKAYVSASNAHDVAAILACFSDDAAVQDEGETLRGKKAIESWIVKTIGKYQFQFKPLEMKQGEGEVVVIEVSGTFKGSPVDLDYHFGLKDGKISSLHIE